MDVRDTAHGGSFQGRPREERITGQTSPPNYRAIDVNAGLMVKVPLPAQFAVAPLTVHVPVIFPLPTVPSSVRVFISTPVDITT